MRLLILLILTLILILILVIILRSYFLSTYIVCLEVAASRFVARVIPQRQPTILAPPGLPSLSVPAAAVPAPLMLAASAAAAMKVGQIRPTWQVEYPFNGVAYWWDYPYESVVQDLENALRDGKVLSFSWVNDHTGHKAAYDAYTRGNREVVNMGTEHRRKLRRIFVSQSADAERQENEKSMDMQDQSMEMQDLPVITFQWQVQYERRGVPYWWDYDVNISSGLERQFKERKLLFPPGTGKNARTGRSPSTSRTL